MATKMARWMTKFECGLNGSSHVDRSKFTYILTVNVPTRFFERTFRMKSRLNSITYLHTEANMSEKKQAEANFPAN